MSGKAPVILIADDQPNIRMMVRTTLETDGFTVLEAPDGRAAVERVRLDQPAVMVLDLNMPVMDGMEVLEQLKDAADRPRILVLTAYGSISAAVRATRLGANDFLEKPMTPDDLRSAVRGVLEDHPPAEKPAVGQPSAGVEYDAVLDRVRKSLRHADLDDAESLLAVAAERREMETAAYFNLLGVLYESQHRWRLARRCYGKAVAANPNYEPAQTNDRRLGEMIRYGRTDRPVLLGDEPDDVWQARMPPDKR
jgi:DNA-binding response OmpR family regulator